jgi:hypothetical protein
VTDYRPRRGLWSCSQPRRGENKTEHPKFNNGKNTTSNTTINEEALRDGNEPIGLYIVITGTERYVSLCIVV